MRTIAYSDVLQKAAEASGRVFADLSAEEGGLLKGFIGTRLRQMWEKWPWPELMETEQRTFRDAWSSATTYAATTEVHYRAGKHYYQSLRAANTNHAPEISGVENSAWWARCAR